MSDYKDLYLSLLRNLEENIKTLQKMHQKSESEYIEMLVNSKGNQGKGKINLKDLYKKDK